jgi:hypothetical protein
MVRIGDCLTTFYNFSPTTFMKGCGCSPKLLRNLTIQIMPQTRSLLKKSRVDIERFGLTINMIGGNNLVIFTFSP